MDNRACIRVQLCAPRPQLRKAGKVRRKKYLYGVLFAVAIGIAGCANYEPLEYTPTSEMRPGPGLFIGEKGAFYIYGDEKPIPKDDLPPRGEN